MNKIELIKVEHKIKVGNTCNYIVPNIVTDSLLYCEGELIGFYMNRMSDKACQLANIANNEFLSNKVPKTEMQRPKMLGYDEHGKGIIDRSVKQYSTILGSIPPKPHMRRNYTTISSVHNIETAQTFIKAMLLLAHECESIIHDIMPEQYEAQKKIMNDVQDKYKFGNLFTSSISNYNISAPYHCDTGNIKNTVNVIICKRLNSIGGDLNVPDYDATFGQKDNSILVYPAWKNIHGVTKIKQLHIGGYRNSLIFYPLKGFNK